MQKVVEIEFYPDGKRTLCEVSYDPEEVKKLRDKVADELSIVEKHKHTSYLNPIYTSKKKYANFEIRHQHMSYLPGIDTWPLIECTYELAVYPYLVRLLDRILRKGNNPESIEEEIREVTHPIIAREYIPIREMLEKYAKILTEGKEFDECNPGFYHSYPYEIDSAEDFIVKYSGVLLDEEYPKRFRSAYKEAQSLFTVAEKEKGAVKVKE